MRFKTFSASVAIAALMATPGFAQDKSVRTKAGPVNIEAVASGLIEPWGLDFLSDGRMIVTEKGGTMRIVGKDGKLSEPLKGVLKVSAKGQGGLLDVAVAPDFDKSRLIYWAFSEPGEGGASTAVARGKLAEGAVEDVEVIFSQKPKFTAGQHFGSRIVFGDDGKIYATTGDRGQGEPAQDVSNTVGVIIRINPDGSVPDDNPFVGKEGAAPEIWTYGNRNGQGLVKDPATGQIWEHEFGPRGGDELNVVEKGQNYGWPVVSNGSQYSGVPIPDHDTRPEFKPPVHFWTPVISPSGMAVYTGDAFPDWKGNILIGGLSALGIVRLTLDGDKVTDEERIDLGVRIRDVVQGPDGAVYALNEDDGEILRLTPGKSPEKAGN